MNLQVLTMRTVGWLLFSPLAAIMLIKKSVPGERLLNENVLHIKEKSHIKIFSSETFGKLHLLTLLAERILYISFGFLLSIMETICYAYTQTVIEKA